jgi:hypothetical protein
MHRLVSLLPLALVLLHAATPAVVNASQHGDKLKVTEKQQNFMLQPGSTMNTRTTSTDETVQTVAGSTATTSSGGPSAASTQCPPKRRGVVTNVEDPNGCPTRDAILEWYHTGAIFGAVPKLIPKSRKGKSTPSDYELLTVGKMIEYIDGMINGVPHDDCKYSEGNLEIYKCYDPKLYGIYYKADVKAIEDAQKKVREHLARKGIVNAEIMPFSTVGLDENRNPMPLLNACHPRDIDCTYKLIVLFPVGWKPASGDGDLRKRSSSLGRGQYGIMVEARQY